VTQMIRAVQGTGYDPSLFNLDCSPNPLVSVQLVSADNPSPQPCPIS